jgi:hypothetical protein
MIFPAQRRICPGHVRLEFWDDWREKNEPGSVAEAALHGWNLLYFVAETNKVAGSEIPQPGYAIL